MAVEVANSNFAIVENGTEANRSTDSEKVNITFGSHGIDEPVKVEATNVSESNLPKDVVDEWPEPPQVHSFFFAKYRALEDQSMKAKLDVAEKDLQKKIQARLQIVDKIKAQRADRAQVIAQLRSLGVESKQFRSIMDEKRKEIEPLRQALGTLRGSGGGERGSVPICSSEEELNAAIKGCQYRIQHESIPLTEEKQILREIKLLEGTRQKVIAFAAERARIQDSMGEKDAIQGQVKLIGNDLDIVKKDRQTISNKIKQLDEEKFAVEKVIGVLEAELNEATEKRDKAFDTIREMRKKREDGNSPFYQNRILLTKTRELAAKKDVDSLKELSETEAEKFMALWNSNKAFRNDYEKRQKPLVRIEAPTTTTTKTEVVVKKSEKQIPKVEDVVAPAKDDVSKTKVGKNNEGNNKKMEKTSDEADEDEYFQTEKSKEALLPKKVEVDEKKLKELRREEEIAKRAQAEERKKKLAEKAAAKAAIKAQKEAEKKLKDREKKAKKKAGGAADSEEATTEAKEEEVAEVEKVEEKIEILPQKNKDRNTVRQRGGRPRGGGPDSFPKAILKRKKATNYWVWAAAPAAALAFVLLVLVGYKYLS